MDFTRNPRLKRVETPTLVIWGADDKINRPDGGATLARTMPNCDLLTVANTGHWVQRITGTPPNSGAQASGLIDVQCMFDL
jgi:pimeloyl-ACP methyl ester carboxylesterase